MAIGHEDPRLGNNEPVINVEDTQRVENQDAVQEQSVPAAERRPDGTIVVEPNVADRQSQPEAPTRKSKTKWVVGGIGVATLFGVGLGLSMREGGEDEEQVATAPVPAATAAPFEPETQTPVEPEAPVEQQTPETTLVVVEVEPATEVVEPAEPETITITTEPVVMDATDAHQLIRQFNANRLCANNTNDLEVMDDCLEHMVGDNMNDNLDLLQEEAMRHFQLRQENPNHKPNQSPHLLEERLLVSGESSEGDVMELIVQMNHEDPSNGTPYEYWRFEKVGASVAPETDRDKWLLTRIMILVDGQQTFAALEELGL